MSSASDSDNAKGDRRRLVVLALEGMDWQFLQQLADTQLAPFLTTLIEHGTWAPVDFPLAACAESAWTTLATGVLPDRHGVLHAFERLAGSIFVQSPTAGTAKAPALWHWADAAGLKVALINWPATLGLSLDHGLVVAPGTETAIGRRGQAWPMHPNAVLPVSLRETVRGLRLHPDEIRREDVEFILAPLSASARKQIAAGTASALAECASLHAMGTHALSNLGSDVVVLRIPFLSAATQLLAQIPAAAGAGTCLARCYQFVDMICGRYMNLAGRNATYAVVSNGVDAVPRRSKPGRSNDGRGFVIIEGPLVRRDATIGPVAATSIAPTLATLLDLPIDDALDGDPILDALVPSPADRPPSTHRSTVKVVQPGDIERTPESVPLDAALLQREGIPLPDFSAQMRFAQQVECETRFALAQVQLIRGQDKLARSVLRDLSSRFPDYLPARILLAEQLLLAGELAECETIARQLPLVRTSDLWADVAYGLIAFARKDWSDASARFERLAKSSESPIDGHAWLGWVFQEQADWQEALRCFRIASESSPRDARVWQGLGTCYASLGRFAEAAGALGRAVSLNPRSAALLLSLGAAWEKGGQPERAANLRARALQIDPTLVASAMVQSAARR